MMHGQIQIKFIRKGIATRYLLKNYRQSAGYEILRLQWNTDLLWYSKFPAAGNYPHKFCRPIDTHFNIVTYVSRFQ
jgi:hypothetical protein